MAAIELSVDQVNQAFIDSQPYYNPVISARSKRYNKIWGKLIKRGNFEYGQGYIKNKFQFHGGTADQSSSRIWQAMTENGDANANECRYQASIINYGIEQKQYTIYQTLRRTEDICLTDILFKWQVKQHIANFMSTFADITLGEWENFSRDAYMTFCDKVFCMEGLPEFTASFGADTVDVSGVDITKVGILNQKVLDRLYQYLYREAPMGALGMKDGMPTFGLMTSAETSTSIIEDDPTARVDMRYANERFLLEGIGHVKEYKSWAHMLDAQSIRFKLSADGTELVRVFPFLEKDTTIGKKIEINNEYIDAPFEISFVIIKDVFEIKVPPANPSFGTAKFDAIGNYGQFFWNNIIHRDVNPLGEIGFWLSRFRGAPEPGDNSDRAFAILHRRNVGFDITLAEICDTNPQSDAVNVTTAVKVGEEDTYERLIVVLEECLAGDIGSAVTVANANAAGKAAVITNYFGGTSYELTFGDTVDQVAWINTGAGTPTVTVG